MSITSKLFTPIQLGRSALQHRVVLAPLTRFRAQSNHVPGEYAAKYYEQRASVPGTLLITEGTFIAGRAGGYNNVPGIWSDEQINAWKKITDGVHANGSFIYLQLWAIGRAANPSVLEADGFPYTSASAVKLSSRDAPPRELTTAEVEEFVQLYATAAHDAVHRAGFDGVEVHGANGYLIDQFIQDVTNKRTDAYGGSIENRARFALEVVDAVTRAVGAERTGIRFSPWGQFNEMRMENPKPQFQYIVEQLAKRHPDLAYVHAVEPRVAQGDIDDDKIPEGESLDFLREAWGDRPFIAAGGFNRDLGLKVAEEKGGLIAYGRPFLANPDLPRRLLKDIPLNNGDRDTYYSPGPVGYIDYEFAN